MECDLTRDIFHPKFSFTQEIGQGSGWCRIERLFVCASIICAHKHWGNFCFHLQTSKYPTCLAIHLVMRTASQLKEGKSLPTSTHHPGIHHALGQALRCKNFHQQSQ